MFAEETGAHGAPVDRYVVEEYLAEGGMGAIYLGKKLGAGGFEKQVVLKQLLPEFTRQPEFIDLFLREARLSATLDHANIIQTIDLVTAGEEYFIVMEFLDGADLRTLLKRAKARKRRLSPAASIFVAREILAALSYAHSKMSRDGKPLKLIHRDISPSNILVSRQGEVKLTDFGIAKASTHNSVFYRVKGKVGYMSPEQARSETLDARSDLYSLAVCLYEMLTGERLFVQVGLTTSAEEMYSQPVPLVSRKVPGLTTELDTVLLKALAHDQDDRYQTAGEFREALMRVAHRNGLLISAPELASHLRDVAGRPDEWREIGEGREASDPGTEIYEPFEGTAKLSSSIELDDYDDEDDDEMLSAVFDLDALVDEGQRRKRRAVTSFEHLNDLRDLELTSFIAVLEGDDAGVGAEPLVDLDAFGSIRAQPDTGRIRSLDDSSSQRAVEIDDPGLSAASDVRLPLDPTTDEMVTEDELNVRAAMAPERGPWFWVILIIVLGAGIAAAIGLSGPEIEPLKETRGR